VEIPTTDGWASSTSSDMVYKIDFYVNGGWNDGQTQVTSSHEFAIVYPATGDPSSLTVMTLERDPVVITMIMNPAPVDPIMITIVNPEEPASLVTMVQTELILRFTTMTAVITAIYQVGTPNPTNTIIVTTVPSPFITVTVTDIEQLSQTTTTMGPSTTLVMTYIGATTIGSTASTCPTIASVPLYNAAVKTVIDMMWLCLLVIFTSGVFVFI